MQNFKNSYNRPRDMRMHHFWAENGPFPQMRIFSEYLLISLVPFIHSCLSTCQKSKSDINLLIKYWWLKNTEISLAESYFWLQLENQIFPKHVVFAECSWTIRTIVLHKFQTKKWRDFLKKSQNSVFGPFLTIVGHFCPMGFCFPKSQLCHTQLYMSP